MYSYLHINIDISSLDFNHVSRLFRAWYEGEMQTQGLKSSHAFLVVVLSALAFSLYANHVWEDYYITYRTSKNLALGKGLVYHDGAFVPVFTSPLNVLLPAFLSLVSFNTSDVLVIWLYRAISICALGAAAVLLVRLLRDFSKQAAVLAVFLLAFDAKIIDFSTNGQEVAFLVFFMGLVFYSLFFLKEQKELFLGLAWAGLMWTRPDMFIYIAASSFSFLVFGREKDRDIKGFILVFLKAGVITTCLYLPWLVWSYWYYGTIIPQSVTAKGLQTRHPGLIAALADLVRLPLDGVLGKNTLLYSFLPTYFRYGGWPDLWKYWGIFLSFLCAFYWLLPGGNKISRTASLTFLFSHIYLGQVNVYPWYFPITTFLGIIALAGVVDSLGKRASGDLAFLVNIFVLLVLSFTVILYGLSAYQMKVQQLVVEDGNRTKIGKWLKEHAASKDDTVFLECVGYIGFFSGLRMYDWPGLASREVTDTAARVGPQRVDKVILELKPDWLVLRPKEIAAISSFPEKILSHYELVKTFDVRKKLHEYRFMPGRGYLAFDQTFHVFKRLDERVNAYASVRAN